MTLTGWLRLVCAAVFAVAVVVLVVSAYRGRKDRR